MMHVPRKQNNGGFALLLSIIISSVVLAIGVSILHISVNQLNLSSTARESEFAFQAANAGIECMTYWRYENAVDYKEGDLPSNSTPCFGANPTSATKPTNGLGANVYRYDYKYQWGSPSRCTQMSMYVLNAVDETSAVEQTDFDGNTGVGVNGTKTCAAGSVCTVIISDGYNRACNEINGSIFSIQREIVLEF